MYAKSVSCRESGAYPHAILSNTKNNDRKLKNGRASMSHVPYPFSFHTYIYILLLFFIYSRIVNLNREATHAERVISGIISTSDSVYFNDAGALALENSPHAKQCAHGRGRYAYGSCIKKKWNALALLSSDNGEYGDVRDHVPRRFEIMRQLLNKVRPPSSCLRHPLSIYATVTFG